VIAFASQAKLQAKISEVLLCVALSKHSEVQTSDINFCYFRPVCLKLPEKWVRLQLFFAQRA